MAQDVTTRPEDIVIDPAAPGASLDRQAGKAKRAAGKATKPSQSTSEDNILFSQLNPLQKIIATIFMAFSSKAEAGGLENNPLASLFAAILGFSDADTYKSWQKDHRDDWKETYDFKKGGNKGTGFDWKAAAKVTGDKDLARAFADGNSPQSLLDLIAKHESGGNYNIANGSRKVNFTNMTIDQVLDWQRRDEKTNGNLSAAAGRYQIIRSTLTGLKEQLGLSGKERFDEAMQDQLATALLESRGYSRFLSGDLKKDDFIKNISKEWASLPKDRSNLSFYNNDGVNKAGIKYAALDAAVMHERSTSLAKAQDPAGGIKGPSSSSVFAQAATEAGPVRVESIPGFAPHRPAPAPGTKLG